MWKPSKIVSLKFTYYVSHQGMKQWCDDYASNKWALFVWNFWLSSPLLFEAESLKNPLLRMIFFNYFFKKNLYFFSYWECRHFWESLIKRKKNSFKIVVKSFFILNTSILSGSIFHFLFSTHSKVHIHVKQQCKLRNILQTT